MVGFRILPKLRLTFNNFKFMEASDIMWEAERLHADFVADAVRRRLEELSKSLLER
jgi:hypothetical protein